MSFRTIDLCLLTAESHIVHIRQFCNASISSDEWGTLLMLPVVLLELKIFIDDTAGIDIMSLGAKVVN